MRVTSEMMVANSLRRLSTRLERYERAQSQLAAGSRLLAASDDPSGTGQALGLRASQRAREQEVRNASDARSWLGLADSQLQAAVEGLQRARGLAVRGSSSLNADERRAIAAELASVRDEMVTIANFAHRGRPLFAGYGEGPAVAQVDGVWTFRGDEGAITRRVGESDVVQVNVTAAAAFGFGSAGGDVFTMLDELVAALDAPDAAAALNAGIGRIDGARRHVGDALARVGANTNRVESARRRSEDALAATRGQLAEVEDVDIAAAIMDLQTQELAYTATLQALARALPPSLVSFLR
ncbi:MAG TPA: flagellin [Egibacteraceae bacterium]|nr:flagellin [Egibacteraceae bacterium]